MQMVSWTIVRRPRAGPAVRLDRTAPAHAAWFEGSGTRRRSASPTSTTPDDQLQLTAWASRFPTARARLPWKAVALAREFAASFAKILLSGANLAHADLDGADFTGADLSITSIKGTDLTRTIGLTQKQLDQACGDTDTKVPAGFTVKTCD